MSVSQDLDTPKTDDTTQAPQAEQVLPVPMGPLRSQLTLAKDDRPRPSFWRRIRMRTLGTDSTDAGGAEDPAARLSAIEQQIEQLDADLRLQLESLSGRLEEIWQPEEQLSHLADIQEKLDRMARQQSQLSESVAGLKRILGWLAALVIVAAAGAEIALKFILES